MTDWHNVYITDKNGGEHFNTVASPMSTNSEIKNLKRHLEQARKHPGAYRFLDVDSAVLMLDGEIYGDLLKMSDVELLAELGL